MSEPVKILLVDDLTENLLALEALLKRDGLALYKALSGREALELVLRHDFALAIIDVHMPEMDGFELAELMRGTARCKQLPIIFATAAQEDRHRAFKGYETGAVDFLHKPIDPRILQRKVEVFFELYRHRQLLAEQLIERERLLEDMRETLRLNEMFTAVLSHDLRGPLGAITSGAALLSEMQADGETRAVCERLLSSGSRMKRMIEQLLDLSRARLAEGIPVQPSRVDLGSLVDRIVAEATAGNAERIVLTKKSGQLEGEWDEGRLEQVLSNLLANALKHGAPGVPVRVCVSGDAQDAVVIVVQNGGVIAPDVLSKLFDPFRAGARTTRSAEGLGLGLYIVHQIVRAHEGSIDVASSEAEGTQFSVRLPRRPRGRASRAEFGGDCHA